MKTVSTTAAAEHMLTTGKPYTAALLAEELGISAQQASGKLYNIRTSSKYNAIVTELPNRTVKLTAIKGRKQSLNSLMKLAIFGNRAA
ncbi:hypothetical protein [Shewanella sp. KCT]|uniref:hypothetical protein n=1 Tax=Shewanella sp. KCT TaxID=2569535 RepID=UPI001183AF0B|nr:hypothetical protein [Shewanella sp. KCT]TVP11759.1 hypothetical protein AYI87_15115 [Shewanella sp. KCT]